MKFLNTLKERVSAIRQAFAKDKKKAQSDGNLFFVICTWVYKLRSVILSIPVAFAAVIMALTNAIRLPETVFLYFPSFSSDDMALRVLEFSRSLAIIVPLLITALSIVAVLCSRRVTYPWLISVFTLVLPLFFYFVTVFP